MNGFDIQAALEIANKFRGIARRAEAFGHDRARIIEELIFAAENYESLADRIEASMVEEV